MYFIRNLFRRLALYIIKKTDEPFKPHAKLTCAKCGGELWLISRTMGWKSPGAECPNCDAIIADKNIRVELVDSADNTFTAVVYRLGK